jgi:hypothetical protein
MYRQIDTKQNWEKMTNLLDIIHRIFFIKTHNVSETGVCIRPETGTSSIYWPQQNRCLLHDDRDRLQSPKRCVF